MRPYRFHLPHPGQLASSPPRPGSGGGRRAINKVMACFVAGSGILNLISLLGGPIPAEEPQWLRGVFPLDFVGLSRTLTLLAGFALILAAIHLWSGKRRALQLSGALAAGSVLFHLTKGWDLEEAVCSGVIAALLWLTRRHFNIGSGKPELAAAVRRAGAAFLFAGLYGAAGFWLLEPVEFHHNFHWWDAIVRTVRIMLFWGDPTLAPHTAYAAWFLDSLYWMSAAALLYSGLVLFRPVTYQFKVNWRESALAGLIATRHGQSAQDFFKHWPDKSYYFSKSRLTFLGYRVWGHFALVLGDPVGPEDELHSTIAEFLYFCRERGWRLGFHQVSSELLPFYEALGFRRIKIGDDAIVDLEKFTLTGSARKEFRNTVTRLDRLGYRVERIDPPLADAMLADLHRISDNWLEIPGHRERQFTLGRFERSYVQSTPVYVAFDANNHAVAFLNLVPSYRPGLATVDLMRRSHDGVNGLMDYLFAKVFLDLKERGSQRFSLGMAPLSDQGAANEASLDEKVVYWTVKRLPFLFRADSLRRFKAKYADEWLPRYAVYESRLDLPRMGLALQRLSARPSLKRLAKLRGIA